MVLRHGPVHGEGHRLEALPAQGGEVGGGERSAQGLRLAAPVAVEPGVERVAIADEAVGQEGAGEAFGDQDRIVAQGGEQFHQHGGVLGVLRHPVHLRLQQVRREGHLPVPRQRGAFAEFIRHRGIEPVP